MFGKKKQEKKKVEIRTGDTIDTFEVKDTNLIFSTRFAFKKNRFAGNFN